MQKRSLPMMPAIKPDKHEVLNNKGSALRKLGRYEDAITVYDAALDMKPDKHEALNSKSVSLLQLGFVKSDGIVADRDRPSCCTFPVDSGILL